ncbi:MAG TPA: glycoside hydrolase family 20 zincin-like fold domain-containing protein [Armatimonadota bacterium]
MVEITECDRRLAAVLDAMPRHISAVPHTAGMICLDRGWRIVLEAEEPRARCGAVSLAAFLERYCGLALPVEIGAAEGPRQIRLRWRGQDGEGFQLTVAPEGILIDGDSPAGALYGAHRLQWLMGEHGGPLLAPGNERVEPGAPERISATPFRQEFDDGDDPLTYTDGYLDLLAHYGINAIHLYIDLFDYLVELPIAPELVNPDAEGRIARMANLAQRAARYNIGLYLHPNALARPVDDPLFTRLPQLKGAVTWNSDSVVLCSSEPLAALIYGESLNAILRRVPQVRGIIAIVGGECLLHCFSRPTPRTAHGTNCPRCGARNPSLVVAEFTNAIAGHVRTSFPLVKFLVWPYSAHMWSGEYVQRPLIQALDPQIGFMTCIDKDGDVDIDDFHGQVFDYAISYAAPSPRYRTQRDLSRERGMPFFVKMESSIAIEMLNVPYIPVLTRWAQRWREVVDDRTDGWLANWRFTGLTGTLSEAAAYWECWRSSTPVDTLRRLAHALAGDAGSDACLTAWERFTDGFGVLAPGMAFGRLFAYFQGPMYLGPAHPLVLDAEQQTRLPAEFYRIDACMLEIFKGEALEKIPKQPLFFAEDDWAEPLGLARLQRLLETACRGWDDGLAAYERALQAAESARQPALCREVDVARIVGVVLHSALNLARFQILRARLRNGDDVWAVLRQVVTDDLENARRGLALVGRDERFGYGFVYGKAFDAQTIGMKIAFTEDVLLPEIDRLAGDNVLR